LSVFISWAHRDSTMTDAEADAWRDQVLALAERLNNLGCNVKLDKLEQRRDWSRWGPRMIEVCDLTLIVMSKAYRQRWDGDNLPTEGAGTAREINNLKGRFDENQEAFRSSIIVILFPEIPEKTIPYEIRGCVEFCRVSPIDGEGMEELIRLITEQPEFVLSPRGEVPELAPRPSVIEHQRPSGDNLVWLDAAVPAQRDEIIRLKDEIESYMPPPRRSDRPYGLDEWIARLGEWADDTHSLITGIENARLLTPRPPSIGYMQAFEDCQISYQHIVKNLSGSRKTGIISSLEEMAQELYRLVNQLVRLALEP
jgi:hypothetical protein